MSVEQPENVGELIDKLATFNRSLPVRVGWEHEGWGGPLKVEEEVEGPFPGHPEERYVFIEGNPES